MTFAYHIANQRIDGSGKRRSGNHQQYVKASANVGYRQWPLAKPFDKNEKHKPRGNRNKILKHNENGQTQYFSNGMKINFSEYKQMKNVLVVLFQGNNYKINQSSEFGYCRCNSCAGNAPFRKTEFAENKQIIKHDIGESGNDSRNGKYFGACNANKKCTENYIEKRKEKTVDSPVEKFNRCLIYMIRMNQKAYQIRYKYSGENENGCGNQKVKYKCIVKNGPDFTEIFLSISSRYQDLRTLTETKSHKINGYVKHTAYGRCTQRYLAYTSQKCSIRYVDNVLSYQRKKNGVGNFEYFFVGIHSFIQNDTKV